MTTPPIPCRWDGEAFQPLPGFRRSCDQHFVVGTVYRLIEQPDRSDASHRHYFACLNEAWANLPEDLASRFPTVDHLRKFALINARYADYYEVITDSPAEAARMAMLVPRLNDYAVVKVSGNIVGIWQAKSQTYRAMGSEVFQASKDAVLQIVAEMIGVDADTLSNNAGRAA